MLAMICMYAVRSVSNVYNNPRLSPNVVLPWTLIMIAVIVN